MRAPSSERNPPWFAPPSPLLVASPLCAADQVELKNGDRLSGTVVKYTGETLVFTMPYSKEIPIAWAEVQSLTTDEPQWVKLSTGEYVSARFVSHGDGVHLESEKVEGTGPIALADVVTIGVPPGARWGAEVKALIDDYDNQPPDDRTKNDVKYLVQLGYRL